MVDDNHALSWRPIETAEPWELLIVTDGENVAKAQKVPSDFGGHYWASDPEGALEWEPTDCIALPVSATPEAQS